MAGGKIASVADVAAGAQAPAQPVSAETASDGSGSQPSAGDPQADAAQAAQAAPDQRIDQTQPAFTPAVAAAQAPSVPVTETVQRLASQIVQTAQGPASQFTLNLHPAELGGVQVKIQVDRRGVVSASMTFDSPQAAADLKAHAADLRAALNDAGFDVSDDGLTFNLNERGQQSAQDSGAEAGAWARQALRSIPADPDTLLTTVNEAAARLQGARGASGLDIRI